ncbi:YccF domain-containing protein [Embleya sp. NPDC020630]|uniref:YccF domain-containing protein n=1 Tax=unclassified Embleya TaxID=2699296 RepID=UPI0037917929
MKTVLNVIWLVFAGFWLAIGYAVAGIVCFLLFFLVVTIPLGIAAWRIAAYALWPFGRRVEWRPDAGAGSMLGNILWIVLFGWWLALGHLVTGVLLCITIIGIPLGLANFKLIPVSLTPLGREIVSTSDPMHVGV